MAMTTSTVSVGGYTVTYHVSTTAGEPRGLVAYFDGDGQPMVKAGASATWAAKLQAMANAANAKGFIFIAPRTPFSNSMWWDTPGLEHAATARSFVDWAAGLYGAQQLHLIGYSGGSTLICKDLAKVGEWPSRYRGGALCIGGGSSTNSFSTPASWRPTFPVRFAVGTRDIEGATTLEWWSAKRWAENASAGSGPTGGSSGTVSLPPVSGSGTVTVAPASAAFHFSALSATSRP